MNITELDSIDVCLRILDGLGKAFESLDNEFDEVTRNHPDENTTIGSRYVEHANLLTDIHKLVVTDLVSLRDGLVCQCEDE